MSYSNTPRLKTLNIHNNIVNTKHKYTYIYYYSTLSVAGLKEQNIILIDTLSAFTKKSQKCNLKF